jgi:hypothetical protein
VTRIIAGQRQCERVGTSAPTAVFLCVAELFHCLGVAGCDLTLTSGTELFVGEERAGQKRRAGDP